MAITTSKASNTVAFLKGNPLKNITAYLGKPTGKRN
jgi:hypothetical protein